MLAYILFIINYRKYLFYVFLATNSISSAQLSISKIYISYMNVVFSCLLMLGWEGELWEMNQGIYVYTGRNDLNHVLHK